MALQESKQGHEIRTSYLDRLDKPGAKLRTLRFVLATTTDPVLKDWAREEAKLLQADVDELNRQIAALETLTPDPPLMFAGPWIGCGCGNEAADGRRKQDERDARVRELIERKKLVDPFSSPD